MRVASEQLVTIVAAHTLYSSVLMRRSDGRIVAVVVPAPPDPEARPVTGAGWTLTLREGWGVVPGERTDDFVVREVR